MRETYPRPRKETPERIRTISGVHMEQGRVHNLLGIDFSNGENVSCD
jgi:hypothetical protein